MNGIRRVLRCGECEGTNGGERERTEGERERENEVNVAEVACGGTEVGNGTNEWGAWSAEGSKVEC
ncbi:MAG: hypothetical protein ACTS44_01880 [Candidatus Hodgkinia cicadicola]